MSGITPKQSCPRSNGTKKLSLSAILVLVFLLFNAMVPVVSAITKITSGALEIGEYLESPDKSKRFVVQADGNAYIYHVNNTKIWSTNQGALTTGRYYVSLSNAGLLCIGDNSNTCIRTIGSVLDPIPGQWDLTLLNNGILLLTDPKGVIRWNNYKYSDMTTFQSEQLFFGQCLSSPRYEFFLCMQTDGNLVTYAPYRVGRYFAQLLYRNSVYLYLSKTGILSLRTITGVERILSTRTNGKVDTYRVRITDDGKIRIEDSKGKVFEEIAQTV